MLKRLMEKLDETFLEHYMDGPRIKPMVLHHALVLTLLSPMFALAFIAFWRLFVPVQVK